MSISSRMTLIILASVFALVLVLAGGGWLGYHFLFGGHAKSVGALKRVQASTKVGITRDRYASLVTDSRIAVDEDCPDETYDAHSACNGIRHVQHSYEMAAQEWTREYGSPEFFWMSADEWMKDMK